MTFASNLYLQGLYKSIKRYDSNLSAYPKESNSNHNSGKIKNITNGITISSPGSNRRQSVSYSPNLGKIQKMVKQFQDEQKNSTEKEILLFS